jgi:hypothetical protein
MGSLLFLFFLVLAIVWGFSTYSEKSAVWEKEAQLAKK